MKGIDVTTKVLTENGWKGIEEMAEHDKVAIYSTSDDKIKYEIISGMSLEEYEGNIYIIDNRWNNISSPSETSVILRYIKCGTGGKKYPEENWHSENLGDITPHGGFMIMNAGKYDGEYEIGELQAMLTGWIISLGYKNYENEIELHQSIEMPNEDFEILKEIINMLEVEHEYSVEQKMTVIDDEMFDEQIIKIPNVESNEWIFDKFDEDFKPKFFLLHLKQNELEMLYEGMNLGNNAYFQEDLIIYIHNDIHIQEFYRILCLHLGYITNYVKKRRAYSALTTQVYEKNYSTVYHVNYHDVFKKVNGFKGTFWYPKITHKHFVVKKGDKISIVGV